MDLSLDDIIKTQRIRLAPSKKFSSNRKISTTHKRALRVASRPYEKDAKRITDARLKIIQKNRARIHDARDKLAEITRASGDARERLLQKKQYIARRPSKTEPFYRNGRISNGHNNNIAERKVLPRSYNRLTGTRPIHADLIGVPRGYVDYDNMELLEDEEYAAASRLSRTVRNDEMDHYPSYAEDEHDPHKSFWSAKTIDNFDPFDVYEVPMDKRTERNIINHISPERDGRLPAAAAAASKAVLRQSSRQQRPPQSPTELYKRRYVPESSSHLSYEMRSRLTHAPDPHASMGIFAKELPTASSGYRIVVSNLHSSVSQSDIEELFADIGELYDSHIVRPGVAEVIYKTLGDAEKAVETYHNRQLDGMPMKCMLVNPRASSKPTAPAIKSSSSSSRQTDEKTPLEIDIDALHKVLFRRH